MDKDEQAPGFLESIGLVGVGAGATAESNKQFTEELARIAAAECKAQKSAGSIIIND